MALPQPPSSWLRSRALFHLRRLSVNAALQICSQVLPLVAGAVAIPIIYRNIGRDEFGVFTIGLSVLGLFALLDLGLGRAAVRFTSRAFADGNTARAASVVVHSALLLGAFSLALCAIVVALAPAIAGHWIQSKPAEHETLRQCIYILAAAVPFAGLTSVFRSVLEAREDFLTISLIQGVLGILTYLIPLALSIVTPDVRVIILGAVICRVAAFAAFAGAAMRAWRGPFPWRSLDLRSETEFRQFSFWTVLSNVIGAAIVYGDRALLVKMFGLAQIAFYNVPVELLGRLMIVVNSAATVAFPSLSRFSGDKAVLERLYVAFTTLLSAVVGAVFLGLSVATPALLRAWLGADFEAHSTLVTRTFLVGMEFQCLNVVALASLNARGFARPITIMHLVETPLYFCALYFLGSRLGLNGVALVWSTRLIVEYGCFLAFQLHVGVGGGARRQRVGGILAACNALPAALVAIHAQAQWTALAWGACTGVSTVWSLRELRHTARP